MCVCVCVCVCVLFGFNVVLKHQNTSIIHHNFFYLVPQTRRASARSDIIMATRMKTGAEEDTVGPDSC